MTAMKKKVSARPPLWKVWWTACRPHTLTASLSPVVVSYNAGLSVIDDIDKSSFIILTIQWAAFCMLIQLGTNLHNDYSDFVKGADTEKRLGQARATQKGWLTPNQTAMASILVLGIGGLLGMNFLANIQDDSDDWKLRTVILVVVIVSSVFNAFAYTGGWPLGYIGLGDLSIGYSGLGDFFVFLYFGLVACLFLPFLYISCTLAGSTRSKNWESKIIWELFPCAIQVAALATNIIVVNNLRDRHTDVHANKRTLAVRFGARFCRAEYSVMIIAAYGLVLLDWALHSYALLRLLPLVSFPLAWNELQAVYHKDGSALNPHVGGSAKVQFFFCVLLGTSVRISS